MTWAILGLSAGFILVLAFLLYLLFKTQLSVAFKFLALTLASAFFIIQYKSLHQFMGWPTTAQLPDEFVLIATNVREPNKQTGDLGIMYWWVRESSDLTQAPRVYELPYKAEMQQKTEDVIKQQKEGAQFIGKKPSNSSSPGSKGVSFQKISKAGRHKKN